MPLVRPSSLRRIVFAALSLCLVSMGLSSTSRAQSIPISGQPVSAFAPLDTIMENLMTQYSSPGASLAISYNGKLVYARGYGYAEVDTKNPVQPDTIMRWASNSKPLTAIGIYNLIQAGKLKLTDKPFVTIFTDLTPPSGTTYNTELNNITIQDLLLHQGGWDDTEVPDPVFEYEDAAAQALGDAVPATPKELIEYMMSQPLQHTPGTTYAYSNLGYIVLGQVISKVSGGNYTSYESYMQTNIFNPHGMGRLQPAQTFLDQQLPNEAAYYDYPNAPLEPNVYDPNGPYVPEQYGGYSLPLNHANGGWAGAAIDVVREWDIMNGQITPAIITNPSIETNLNSSVGVYFPTAPVGEGWIYTFFGSLPGTNSLVHMDTSKTNYPGNLTFGAVFNTRNGDNIEEPETDATNQIATALQSVKTWPSGDLFSTYPGPGSACKFSLSASSKSFTKSGGSGSVTVADANYCAWLSLTSASWIHITSGALNSNAGSTGYTVDANSGSSSRTGTISIANLTYTITEAGGLSTSTTSLTSTPNPVTVGQNVTLKATVGGSSGTPTGSVAFTVGSTTLATVAVNGSGVASLTASSNGEAPGTYPIVAKYSGSSTYADSSSTADNVVVNKAPTSTAVSASPTSVTPPGNVTLTATVKRSTSGATGTPTGSVTFYANGSVALATIKVNSSGVASLTASTNGYGAGTYSITAKYAGDTSDVASTSSAVNVTLK
jgi:CubicO group peptidase (beta-lactamase class C family)